MQKECPICKAGLKGYQWTRKVVNGKASITDLAMRFNVDFDLAKEHIEKHPIDEIVTKKFEETDQVLKHGEYVKEFKFMLTILREKIEELYGEDDVKPQAISALSKLVDNMRKLLMDIAEYDGRVHKGQVNVVIEQQQKELDLIIDIILNEVCPSCRVNVLNKLEEAKIGV